MMSPNLIAIERSIRALSLEEQLWLLERIARQVRRTHTAPALVNANGLEERLAMMASDPEIQAELATINQDAVTESDGLEQQ